MENRYGANSVEKARLRDRIAEQVQRFLESGGRITVIDTPQHTAAPKGSAWQVQGDTSPLLD